jgi:GH15 family glucan-1,4-alpha-glucosidase
MERTRLKHLTPALLFLGVLGLTPAARAEVPVTTTVRYVPGSNGHGAFMLDLEAKRLVHFREHSYASEEPLLDAGGKELWNGNQPLSVPTRDLLYDAYFGLRVGGDQAWITGDPTDLTKSGYLPRTDGSLGGTGIVRMVQSRGALRLTQYVFAPRGLEHAGFVMALEVENTGSSPAVDVAAFSLHNFHLGYGRPGVREDLGENGETATFEATTGTLAERGFAGVVVARPLAAPSRHAASFAGADAGNNLFAIVDSGTTDFPNLSGEAAVHDGTVTGFQWNLGTIPAGGKQWVGVAFAHHGDPFASKAVEGWLDGYAKGRGAEELVSAERDEWNVFQSKLNVPPMLTATEESIYRHQAVMLAMAQVKEGSAFLREHLSKDGEARYTRFGTAKAGPAATLPGNVVHHGKGAILASLPPGEWTVSWLRDGSYAAAAMARMGMAGEAKDALAYFLDAEGGRFQAWKELAGYPMPPYRLSLVRYHGMGVEETDFNDFGPNLEFDGFGLFLWALRTYQRATGDDAFVQARFGTVGPMVADALVALIEPETGLLRPDSSIWETHWNGRERHWAYTSITAARGLCDAADLATLAGDPSRAENYRAAGIALRKAIAEKLTDASGAIASNMEELASGSGYRDAAVLDAIAFGLFDPKGTIAQATMAGVEAELRAPAGAGWARNDDRTDHGNGVDLSPWGSEYDSGEWAFVDLRGAVAATRMGDAERAARLTQWVGDQAVANYLEMGEVFDEAKGTYKFNAPMIGFGAGAYALALLERSTPADPACGAYFDEGDAPSTGSGTSGSGGPGGGEEPTDASGCGCHIASVANEGLAGVAALVLGVTLVLRRTSRARRRAPRSY